ncbi:hypothetical protein LG943_12450 [Streptomonospora sp. S1-112]|uniref:Uncharacterized protein n=1 Tax=Streptomonospora mangrovi TaxID=2883123 RepID=A0A9X3SHC7_9ACTN|nr:hypothetical protein [Streptomonospora mangrovi]MDA0565124.1 hypothetical protein [Streptomonospora mangrovi]
MAKENGHPTTKAGDLSAALADLEKAVKAWEASRDTLAELHVTSGRLLSHLLNDTRNTPGLGVALSRANGAAHTATSDMPARVLGQDGPALLEWAATPEEALKTRRPKVRTEQVRQAVARLDASREAMDKHIRVIRGAESDIAGYENGRTGLESILRSGLPQVGTVGEAAVSIKSALKFPPAEKRATTTPRTATIAPARRREPGGAHRRRFGR